ncbi:MAG: hypothetical protein R3B70_48195 [Polyangiaceae bacterium]
MANDETSTLERQSQDGEPAEGPSDFDRDDELLARVFELCSPEQKMRGATPREVLMRLAPEERTELLERVRATGVSVNIVRK